MNWRRDWLELRPLRRYLRPHRRPLTVGVTSMVVSDTLGMLSPLVLRAAVDHLAQAERSEAVIGGLAALLVGIALVDGAFKYLMRNLIIGVSRRIEYGLRNDLYAHLQRLPPAFFGRVMTGDLMSRATNDLGNVRMLVGPAFMYLGQTLVTTVVALALMATLHPLLVLWALVPLLALTTIARLFGNRIHERAVEVQEETARLSTTAQENLAGIRVVKAFCLPAAQVERFRRRSEALVTANIRMVRLNGLLWPLLSLVAGGSLVGALYLGGLLVIAGRISLGSLVAFLHYLGLLTWPMISLGWVLNLIERGTASMRRLNQLLAMPAAPPEPAPETLPRSAITGSAIRNRSAATLELDGVSFRYAAGEIAGFEVTDERRPGGARLTRDRRPDPASERPFGLHELRLRIPSQATVGIVGPTGAGKSTLLHLLVRLHDPTGGRLLLDGTDLRALRLQDLRRRVALVPQDVFLFSDTLAANIAFGAPATPRRRIEEVVALAALAEDVQAFPEGLDTEIGERGVTLSGGQKARVALARALLVEPDVLLLDDCLRNLDTHTEEEIMQRLRDEFRARTTLIVTHRISTVQDADFLVVLDDGGIRELGTHGELLARDGLYASLHRRQQLAAELEAEGAGR